MAQSQNKYGFQIQRLIFSDINISTEEYGIPNTVSESEVKAAMQ